MQVAIDYTEDMELEVLDFPEWLKCPYCGDEGTWQSLSNSGHICCREFLQEFEED